MTKESIHRFVMHYERLTRHNLNDLQSRADLTLFLDENHNFYQVRTRIAPRDA
jgi:D-glycerate 3-kinase